MVERRDRSERQSVQAGEPLVRNLPSPEALQHRSEQLLDEMSLGAAVLAAGGPGDEEERRLAAGEASIAGLPLDSSAADRGSRSLASGRLVERSRSPVTGKESPVAPAPPATSRPHGSPESASPRLPRITTSSATPSPHAYTPPPRSRPVAEDAAPAVRQQPARPVRPTTPSTAGAPARPPELASAEESVAPSSSQAISVEVMKARALQEEITGLYAEVNAVLTSRREVTGHALALLREARTIVMTQPQQTGKATYNIRQVRAMLERARQSRRSSSRNTMRLALYLSGWFLACLAGAALLYITQDMVRGLVGSNTALSLHIVPFLLAFLVGGMGGVLGAIAGLVNHTREQQIFDRQFSIRFTIQPIMGVVLGATTYVLFALAYSYMEVDLVANPVLIVVPVLAALAAGLWQELVYSLLYRLGSLFAPGSRRRV